MAEELQALLERIQSEGVAKADAKAASIIADAEKKASKIVADAKTEAAALLARAQDEAAVLQSRSEASLKQSARDVVLTVQRDVQETVSRLVRKDVAAALSGDVLKNCIEAVAKSSLADGAELRVPEANAQELLQWAQGRLSAELSKGLKIAPDKDVSSGIRVLVDGGRIEHDFTGEAIAEALAKSIRPGLAKIAFGR